MDTGSIITLCIMGTILLVVVYKATVACVKETVEQKKLVLAGLALPQGDSVPAGVAEQLPERIKAALQPKVREFSDVRLKAIAAHYVIGKYQGYTPDEWALAIEAPDGRPTRGSADYGRTADEPWRTATYDWFLAEWAKGRIAGTRRGRRIRERIGEA